MALKVVVENKRTYRGPGHYVGRPSPLGNPYQIGPDGTREEVIAKYRLWLLVQTRKSRQVRDALNQLAQELQAKGQITLVCWCAPLACHAEVVGETVKKMVKGE